MRLAWRLDALDTWRKSIDRDLGTLAATLGELTKADEIADAVAKKMNDTHTLHLTFVQRAAVFLVGLSSLAAAVKVLVT